MPRVSIDNREVEVVPGSNLLAAARKLGLDIPALCYLPGCTPNTACMACIVRLNDPERIVPACATRAEDGMQIESETPEIHELRRTALELMLSDHAGARWGEPGPDGRRHVECDCGKREMCRLRKYAELYGADPERYRGAQRSESTDKPGALAPGQPGRYDHPEIVYEPARCILCGICVQLARQAGEPLGLTFVGRGFDIRVDVPFGDSLEKALRSAGRRVAGACPTGALRLRDQGK